MLQLLLMLALPAAAVEVDREELAIIGWDTACSVAINHLGYPKLGEAIVGEPISTQIGTLTIRPGEQKSAAQWKVDWGGPNSWSAEPAQKAIKDLIAAGYDHRGFMELVRDEPVAGGRDLDEVILSTRNLEATKVQGWPGSEWRVAKIDYNRLATCAFLIFEKKGEAKPFYRYVLARVYNTQVRSLRSRAHLNNGLLLFGTGDLPGALAETGIAAALYPEAAANRYHYAAMLCLSGYLEEAIAELAEAIKLKPAYREQARKDQDFETVLKHPRFKALMKP